MLPRNIRLKAGEFPRRSFTTASSSYFFVKAAKNVLTHNRFGIVVSKAVSGSSVTRHFLKRRIAECARELPNMHMDFLVIPSSKAASLTASEVREKVRGVFTAITGS